jgi:hypothetical protein
MKECCRFQAGDRVRLMVVDGVGRSATVVRSTPLDTLLEMDDGGPGRMLPAWTWELDRLDPEDDRGPPAWSPRSCPLALRRRLRKAKSVRRH